jgi:hypothetical protein
MPRPNTCLLVALAVGFLLGTAEDVRAQATAPPERELSDEAELERVLNLYYYSGKYSDCAASLGSLLDKNAPRRLKDASVIESARVWHATCLLGSGNNEAAKKPLRDAIEENPTMRPPDGSVFPPPLVELFTTVQDEMRAVIEADRRAKADLARRRAEEERKKAEEELRRQRQLFELASTETVLVQNSRWLAAIPFGVGQFQNRDPTLGWLFLVSEGVLLGGVLTTAIVYTDLMSQLTQGGAGQTVRLGAEQQAQISNWHTGLIVTSWAFLGVTALGIAEAQLSFEPEFPTTRSRRLPKHLLPDQAKTRLVLHPTFSAGGEGVGLGIVGKF